MERKLVIAALTVSLALAGCGKQPTGQVVAVVNGEEITLQELNAELSGRSIPDGADKKAVMAQLLQRVIDRKLLAQAAKEQGLDRDPSYLTQKRKSDEELLVSMYAKKAADSIQIPDTGAVDKFIDANPAMFSERKRYKLEQIRFPMPADPNQLKVLEPDHTLDAVAATLTKLGIKFQRGTGAMDSGNVPAATLKRITDLPPGEPFVVPVGSNVVVSVITGSEPLVVPGDQARQLAVQEIRKEDLSDIGQARLKEAKSKAKIEYQAGYGPPQSAPKQKT